MLPPGNRSSLQWGVCRWSEPGKGGGKPPHSRDASRRVGACEILFALTLHSFWSKVLSVKLTRNHLWPFLIMGLVFFASGRSRLATPDVPFSVDKIGHFLVFGMLAVSWLRHPLCAGRGWVGGFVAVVLTSGYGALDEWRQSFTPGREVEVWDWVADTLGAVVATGLLLSVPRLRKLLESAPADIRLQRTEPSDRCD